MFKGIDHIAIAVEDIDDALRLFETAFGLKASHRETIAEYNVEVATIPLGTSALELVQGTTADSPITKFIEKRGPGIHHIALEVDNIEQSIAQLHESVEMIDEKPRRGKDGSRVAFIDPRGTQKVLYELVENATRKND